MKSTTLRPLVAMTFPLAQGHEATPQGPRVIRPAANNAASWPAGSIFSNVLDLSRFVIAFLNDGRIDGQQVPSLGVALLAQAELARPSRPCCCGHRPDHARGYYRLQSSATLSESDRFPLVAFFACALMTNPKSDCWWPRE